MLRYVAMRPRMLSTKTLTRALATKALTVETMNKLVVRAEYAVRGSP